jgi:hypothetical protein
VAGHSLFASQMTINPGNWKAQQEADVFDDKYTGQQMLG